MFGPGPIVFECSTASIHICVGTDILHLGEWLEQEVCARMSAWYAGTTQTLFIVPKQQLMVIM